MEPMVGPGEEDGHPDGCKRSRRRWWTPSWVQKGQAELSWVGFAGLGGAGGCQGGPRRSLGPPREVGQDLKEVKGTKTGPGEAGGGNEGQGGSRRTRRR